MFNLQRILWRGLSLFCFTQLLLALPTENVGRQRWLADDEERLSDQQPKNISSDCYLSLIECNSRCAVACDEGDDCDGVRGIFYRCASNYWLVVILIVVLILFLVVFLVACQCVDKGQGCANVDLYPRILGNHRRSQRRGINTVQYFTAVRAGRNGQNRKVSAVSHSSSFSQQRSSISSSTPLAASQYQFL